MTKAEFAKMVAKKTESTVKDAEKFTNAALEVVTECLASGETLAFTGFGTFATKVKPAHTSKNPRTGEMVDVPEKTVPGFKAGKGLKEAVNK